MRIRLAAGLILVVAALAPGRSLHSAPSSQGGAFSADVANCTRVTLLQPPQSAATGAWSANGSELLVADALNRTILRYSVSGRSLGPLPDPIRSFLAPLSPAALKADPTTGGSLVEVDGSRFLQLDRTYRPVSTYPQVEPQAATAKQGTQQLEAPFAWEPLGGDILAFADIRLNRRVGEPQWTVGFVRYPLGRPDAFTLLREYGRGDPVRTIQRLGFQYIAAIKDTAYVLAMENPPAILVNHKGETEFTTLRTTLPGLEARPDLPTLLTKDDVAPVMAAVEQSTMPVGLYSFENRLYMVARFFRDGATVWEIWQLDPESGAILSKARIPTNANHITVIPGPKAWAIVEKGPVTGWGPQEIRTALFIPAAVLQGPTMITRGGMLCRSIAASN
jgi:hypothetical protein